MRLIAPRKRFSCAVMMSLKAFQTRKPRSALNAAMWFTDRCSTDVDLILMKRWANSVVSSLTSFGFTNFACSGSGSSAGPRQVSETLSAHGSSINKLVIVTDPRGVEGGLVAIVAKSSDRVMSA